LPKFFRRAANDAEIRFAFGITVNIDGGAVALRLFTGCVSVIGIMAAAVSVGIFGIARIFGIFNWRAVIGLDLTVGGLGCF
jgi:hypothetical protein